EVYCSFFLSLTATPLIYTLSLHDALPISLAQSRGYRLRQGGTFNSHLVPPRAGLRRVDLAPRFAFARRRGPERVEQTRDLDGPRSEEHTSELQSRAHLVCRLLREKKNDTP